MSPPTDPRSRGAALAPALPFALLVLLGLGWSGAYTLAKVATLAGAPPLGLALWGGLGSGMLMLALLAALRRRLPLDRRHLVFYTLSGLSGVAVPDVAIYWSAYHLPVGTLTLLIALAPILTYGLALVIRIETFTLLRALGLLAGVASVAFIVLPEAGLPSPALRGWVAVAILGTFSYALQNVLIARWGPPQSDSLVLSCGGLIVGGLMLVPAVLLTDTALDMMPPWRGMHAAALGVVAVTALCTASFVALVRSSGPVFAAQVAYVVTIAGLLWGAVLYGEQPSNWIWASVTLTFAGVAMVRTRRVRLP